MDSTGEDVLDDILLEHHKDGIHTIQKTVSFFVRWSCSLLGSFIEKIGFLLFHASILTPFPQIVDGKAMVITSEPANMQAMLATQFPVSSSLPINKYEVESDAVRPASPREKDIVYSKTEEHSS